jgi:hypothetical protein
LPARPDASIAELAAATHTPHDYPAILEMILAGYALPHHGYLGVDLLGRRRARGMSGRM